MYRSHPNKHLELAWSEADTGIQHDDLPARKAQRPLVLKGKRRNLYLCSQCNTYCSYELMSLPRDLYICKDCKPNVQHNKP
jgi:hypothetical protein